MSKLSFFYGCMNSSKTAQILMTKFSYEQKGYKVLLLKPSIDNRDGEDIIKSRIGLQSKCKIISEDFDKDTFIDYLLGNKYNIVLIDEAQFLSAKNIDLFKYISVFNNINVICYGLKNDFQTNMFEGSKRLFEIADELIEIKTVCKCGNQAEVNCRLNQDEEIIKDGSQVVIGGNELYEPMCWKCYYSKLYNNKH